MKKILILTLFFFPVCHAQLSKDLAVYRGDSTKIEFIINGNIANKALIFVVKLSKSFSSPRLIQKKNILAGGSASEITATYSAPLTKVTVFLRPDDTQDLEAATYYYDIIAANHSDIENYITFNYGKLTFINGGDVQTPFDGTNLPEDGTRVTTVSLDNGSAAGDVIIWDAVSGRYVSVPKDSLKSLLGVDVLNDSGSVNSLINDTSMVLREEWKNDIKDSLSKNLVTEAYNLFSITKEYPVDSDIILFRQKEGVRIDSVLVVVSGGSLTFNLKHGTLASPDSLFASYQTANSTTGQIFDVNDFYKDTLFVNEWVKISFVSVSGVASVTAIFYWTPLSASTFVPVRTSPSEYVNSYNENNDIIDFFNGGRNIYRNNNYSPAINNSGFLQIQDTVSGTKNLEIDTTYLDPKLHDAFVIKAKDGSALPKFVSASERNDLLLFGGGLIVTTYDYLTEQQKANATIGFWIDRTELNGNGLNFCSIGGTSCYITNAQLLVKGTQTSDSYGGLWYVTEVDGDYTHLTFQSWKYIYNSTVLFRIAIHNESAYAVNQLTIYNPTLIYNKNIDPYYRYKSLAEKNNSRWIGKNILYSGDSQYNDGWFAIILARETGANLYDHHYGGYRMYYSATSWFYQDTIRTKMLNTPNIDIYIFPFSSNDGNGGGDLSTSAVDSVKYFYPVYGEGNDSSTIKLARFALLSEGTKSIIFKYKQTFSAFLEQVQTNYPDSKIIICSIPLSAGSGTMTGSTDVYGDGIWQSPYNPTERWENAYIGLEVKRQNQLELKAKHSTYFSDCQNEVGLNWWNMTHYITDGVHWNTTIDKRIGYSVLREIWKIE